MDLKVSLKGVVDCVNDILEKNKNNKQFYSGLHTDPKPAESFSVMGRPSSFGTIKQEKDSTTTRIG